MSENNNGSTITEPGAKQNISWAVSPKEFIFRYLPYLPLVALSAGVFLFLAYIKIRYTPPIFRVQSSLMIKENGNDGVGSKDERFTELFMTGGSANLSNEIQVLQSRPVMKRVGDDLNLRLQYINKGNVKSSLLYPNSPFVLDVVSVADSAKSFSLEISLISDDKFLVNESKSPSTFGQLIDLNGNRFRILRNKDVDLRTFVSSKYELRWLSGDDMATSLVGGLKITQPADQATILTLTYESENFNLGKDLLNTLMAVYDTLMVEDKNRIASNTLRFINDRLYDLSDTLKGVEGGLSDFMIKNEAFDIEGQGKAFLDNIGEGTKAKTDLEVKRGIVNFLLEYVSADKNKHELVPTNLGIDEPALLQLVGEYNRLQLERDANLKTTSSSAPLIVAMSSSLEKMRQNIYQALLNVKQAYNIAGESLDKKEAALHNRIVSLPGKSMQLLNRERKQKILEDLYSLLLQKKLDISISSASTISNSKVVEPAIASYNPVSPDKKKIYSFYLVIGLLIPISFIALREALQDKVRGKTDLEKNTTVPIIGEIGHSEDSSALVVRHNSRSLISEQFRAIRTNLQYVGDRKGKPVILVTSTFSGEGKSFVSTNMGAVMALSGKKTVIMEFDIRKPKIVSGLDLKRKMGITNYIIGKASFKELIVKVEGIDDLYVIPCGPIPPNPAELLLDSKMDELMKEVLDNFEVVIMDTAPVGLVSDATNLAKYANTSIYIVRQGYTFRKQLGMIEEIYHNRQLPSLCTVLNDIKADGGYYGGYYSGAYGYYGNAYGHGSSGYFEDERGNRKKKGFFSRTIKRIFG